jgi:hypothetical protein
MIPGLANKTLSMAPPSFVFLTMPPKGRGFKFTVCKLEHLLEIINAIIPISNAVWESVWDQHVAGYPTKERTSESLKRKFQELARKKMPTGDPNCPHHVRFAKRIYRKIVAATDGSTGGSDVEMNFDEGKEDKDDDEAVDDEDDDEPVNSSFSNGDDELAVAGDHSAASSVSAAAATGNCSAGDAAGENCSAASSKGKRKEGEGGEEPGPQAALQDPKEVS